MTCMVASSPHECKTRPHFEPRPAHPPLSDAPPRPPAPPASSSGLMHGGAQSRGRNSVLPLRALLRDLTTTANAAAGTDSAGADCRGAQAAVQEDRTEHTRCSQKDQRAEGSVEEQRRDGDGHDDGQGGCEALQDVVRVLEDDGHQQPAPRIVDDRRPDDGRVPIEEVRAERLPVAAGHQGNNASDHREPCQVQVPDRQGHRRTLQQFFEVDARQPRADGCHQHGEETWDEARIRVRRNRRRLCLRQDYEHGSTGEKT
mmetsp:Transcript_105422/g.267860  ORF Transcript_105422/g.267860 Transcript_105422/m.267860 type:complete len:258 (-) Transcript_105422:542-1315(-)